MLAAAPTTPPCFRRWRRSSLLQRKNYFKFWGTETPAGVSVPFFHGRSRKGKRKLPRLFPAETVARRENVLALSVCSLRSHPPLPKGEALAEPEGLHLHRKVCRHAKGSPFGRAGAAAPERARTLLRGGSFVPNSTFWGENRKRLSKVHKKAAQSLAGAGLTVPGREYLRNNRTN